MKFQTDNTFTAELPADVDTENYTRQVYGAAYSFVTPRPAKNASLIHVSQEVADMLGISEEMTKSQAFVDIFSGNKTIENSPPYAMAYGGHQFGQWAGQLGDGRAINLGEIVHNNKRWTLQLKGAGKTPYSRTADGLAVLRSSVREHLCSEAMHALGVPTTRSLSLMLSGEEVLRDMFYDGHAAYEKGAIVCRVAPSFIRFGNFQLFRSRGDTETLQLLTDYTIRHFFPQIEKDPEYQDMEPVVAMMQIVAEKTCDMIVDWQRVGFVHGVMNTDNMSVLGLTIDYGPYGWTDDYNHDWTPNTTDSHQRRYRFGNQPKIALWNLWQLANTLAVLVEDTSVLEEVLQQYQTRFKKQYLKMMMAKTGLLHISGDTDSQQDGLTESLISQLEMLLQESETDMTIFFRQLADAAENMQLKEVSKDGEFKISRKQVMTQLNDALYQPQNMSDDLILLWQNWFAEYWQLLAQSPQSAAERKAAMNKVNPKYVLRNYMVQMAIDKADEGDYSLLNELHEMLKKPYDEQPEYGQWFAKRPDWAKHKAGCSMLSCSS